MVDLTVSRIRAVAPARSRSVGLAALLILGILGMHALAQHCAVSATDPGAAPLTSEASMSVAMSSGVSAHAHTLTSEPVSAAISTAVATGISTLSPISNFMAGPDLGQQVHAMVMLCAVMMLTAGTALFALLGFRRGWPRGWSIGRAWPLLAQHVPAPLGTGPPYVVAFAVIRC